MRFSVCTQTADFGNEIGDVPQPEFLDAIGRLQPAPQFREHDVIDGRVLALDQGRPAETSKGAG
jgi:hypothetical protein